MAVSVLGLHDLGGLDAGGIHIKSGGGLAGGGIGVFDV